MGRMSVRAGLWSIGRSRRRDIPDQCCATWTAGRGTLELGSSSTCAVEAREERGGAHRLKREDRATQCGHLLLQLLNAVFEIAARFSRPRSIPRLSLCVGQGHDQFHAVCQRGFSGTFQ